MKKSLFSLLLVLALALSLCATAAAFENHYPGDDGDPVFEDVDTEGVYYHAVVWAVQRGITRGTSETTFSPDTICTRAHVVTFLNRAIQDYRTEGAPLPNPFKDVPQDSWFEDPVLWAVDKGITDGTGTDTFSPENTCTYAHILTFLWRAAGKPAPKGTGEVTKNMADTWYKDAVAWADELDLLWLVDDTRATAESFDPDTPCTRLQTVAWLYRDLVREVSDVGSFAEAIGPGRTIYLTPRTYDLSEWMDVSVMEARYPSTPYLYIGETYDGYELRFRGLDSIRIIAEGPVEFTVEPRFSNVLVFESCDSVYLEGLTLGHTPEKGECDGSVLRLEYCGVVGLQNCELYGCGTFGISAEGVDYLTVNSTVICDCTEGVMTLNHVNKGGFNDCAFRNCTGHSLLYLLNTEAATANSGIFFSACEFKDNTWTAGVVSTDGLCGINFSRCAMDKAHEDSIRSDPYFAEGYIALEEVRTPA